MRVIVQLIDLNEPLRTGITSHINAKWPSVTIAVGEALTQENRGLPGVACYTSEEGGLDQENCGVTGDDKYGGQVA